MKKKAPLIILILGFLIIILIFASILNDILFWLFKEKATGWISFIIKVVIIFIFINFILKYSKFGKEINNSMEKFFKRKFKKLKW